MAYSSNKKVEQQSSVSSNKQSVEGPRKQQTGVQQGSDPLGLKSRNNSAAESSGGGGGTSSRSSSGRQQSGPTAEEIKAIQDTARRKNADDKARASALVDQQTNKPADRKSRFSRILKDSDPLNNVPQAKKKPKNKDQLNPQVTEVHDESESVPTSPGFQEEINSGDTGRERAVVNSETYEVVDSVPINDAPRGARTQTPPPIEDIKDEYSQVIDGKNKKQKKQKQNVNATKARDYEQVKDPTSSEFVFSKLNRLYQIPRNEKEKRDKRKKQKPNDDRRRLRFEKEKMNQAYFDDTGTYRTTTGLYQSQSSGSTGTWNKEGSIEDVVPDVSDVKSSKIARAIEGTFYNFRTGGYDVNTQGFHYDKEGNGSWTDNINRRIEFLTTIFGNDADVMSIHRSIFLAFGGGIDTKGDIMNHKKSKDWTFLENNFIQVTDYMMKSVEVNGHPFGIVGNTPLVIDGQRRYPIPPPIELCQKLVGEGSILKYQNAAEMYKDCVNRWTTNTQPALRTQETKEKVSAVEGAAMAIQHGSRLNLTDNDFTRMFNLDSTLSRRIDEILKDNRERAAQRGLDIDEETDNYRRQILDNVRNYITKRTKRKVLNANGTTEYIEKKPQGKFMQALGGFSTWQKISGIVGDVPLLIATECEHLISTGKTILANKIIGGFSYKDQKYWKTERLLNEFTSEEGIKALAQAKLLMDVDPAIAIAFYNSGQEVTKENIDAFIRENAYMYSKDPGKLAKAVDAVNRGMSKLIAGDLGFSALDARRFLEAVLNEYNQLNKSGQNSLTAAQLEEAITGSNIGAVIADLMKQGVGTRAIIDIRTNTFGRISPLSVSVERLARMNGLTNFICTTFLFKYPKFYANVFQMVMPMTNTMSYLVTKGLYKNGKADLREMQLGGESIGTDVAGGLRKCIINDCLNIAHPVAVALFLYGVYSILGVSDGGDDDDLETLDESLWLNWDEYYIGGVQFKYNWWLHDTISWGAPIAIALCVGQKYGFERGVGVLLDGLGEVTEASIFTKFWNLIYNSAQSLESVNYFFTSDDSLDEKVKKFEIDFAIGAFNFVNQFVKNLTPGVVDRLMKETLIPNNDIADRTPYYRRNYDSDNPYARIKLDEKEDAIEINQRYKSQDSFAVALLSNLLFSPMGITDFLFQDQAYDLDYNELQLYYMDQYRFEPIDPTKEEWEEFQKLKNDSEAWKNYRDATARSMIEFMTKKWETPEQAAANGWAMNPEVRIYARQMLLAEITQAKNANNQEYYAGEKTKDEYWARVHEIQELSDKNWSIVNTWLGNEDVFPWGASYQVRVLTDRQYSYWNKADNRPATYLEYIVNRGNVERVKSAYGNLNSSISPILPVRKTGNYNNESIPDFYDPMLTDIDSIRESLGDATVSKGTNAGKKLADVVISPEGTLTTGARGTMSIDDYENEMRNRFRDVTEESAAASEGLDLNEVKETENSIKNGGGSGNYGVGSRSYRSYRRSGGYSSYSGGGGYNPKIYSNSKLLNFNKAATMYTKQPYGATVDYLRPSFSTKGSREAYRRQDF